MNSTLAIEADVAAPPDTFVFRYTKELFGRARRESRPARVTAPLVLFYGANEATTSSFKSRLNRRRRGEDQGNLPSEEEEFLYRAERGLDMDAPAEHRFGRSEAIRSFVIDALKKISAKFIDFAWRFEPSRLLSSLTLRLGSGCSRTFCERSAEYLDCRHEVPQGATPQTLAGSLTRNVRL